MFKLKTSDWKKQQRMNRNENRNKQREGDQRYQFAIGTLWCIKNRCLASYRSMPVWLQWSKHTLHDDTITIAQSQHNVIMLIVPSHNVSRSGQLRLNGRFVLLELWKICQSFTPSLKNHNKKTNCLRLIILQILKCFFFGIILKDLSHSIKQYRRSKIHVNIYRTIDWLVTILIMYDRDKLFGLN